MTIENERLIEYLGLEFELCYLKPSGDAVWILADKIRRRDDIAMEMLRLFHRFTRIGKSLDCMNPRPVELLELDDGKATAARVVASSNSPYATCIGVRIRVKDHVASFHVRPGTDVALVANAPRLSSSALLDPRFELSANDPILQVLSQPKSRRSDNALTAQAPKMRARRLKE